MKRSECSNKIYRGPLLAIVMLMIAVWLAACSPGSRGSNSGSSNNAPVIVSSDPDRSDIINAVRRGVNGKTYTERVVRWETVRRTCSQMDVETDIYMPNNPELAKCPRVGATYTEQQSYTETMTQRCAALPDASASWSVQETGSDRWRVGYGGRLWNVELISGSASNLGDVVQVSSFSFVITTNQDC